jgi:hypothetical protein
MYPRRSGFGVLFVLASWSWSGFGIVCGLASWSWGHGQQQAAVLLREEISTQKWRGYELETNVVGQLYSELDGKRTRIGLQGRGTHTWAERVLTVANSLAERTVRYYHQATIEVQLGGEKHRKTLRSDRCCIVYGRLPDGSRGFSPQGPLTRDELELTTEHLAPAALAGLLPGTVVRAGDSWKVSAQALGDACLLDAVLNHEVQGELLQIHQGVAEFVLRGKVQGIDKGAQVRLHLEVRGRFNSQTREVLEWHWEQRDERDAGWWNPPAQLQIRAQLRRQDSKIPLPSFLQPNAETLQTWMQPSPSLLQLEVDGPQRYYRLRYGRDWYIVGQTDSHMLLRLVERGVVIAQLTLTQWRSAAQGFEQQIAEFRKAVAATPAWKADRTLAEGEVPKVGRPAYRIVQIGMLGDQKAIQHFWFICGPNNEHLAATTTIAPERIDQLAGRDEELLRQLIFPLPK